jgi:hypothetical protein
MTRTPFWLPRLFFAIVAECLRRRRQRPGWWPRTIRFPEKQLRVFSLSFPVRTTTDVVDCGPSLHHQQERDKP